jgi:hypothetical protein
MDRGLPTDGRAEPRMKTFAARGFKNGHHLWRVAVVGQGRLRLLVIRSSALRSIDAPANDRRRLSGNNVPDLAYSTSSPQQSLPLLIRRDL